MAESSRRLFPLRTWTSISLGSLVSAETRKRSLDVGMLAMTPARLDVNGRSGEARRVRSSRQLAERGHKGNAVRRLRTIRTRAPPASTVSTGPDATTERRQRNVYGVNPRVGEPGDHGVNSTPAGDSCRPPLTPGCRREWQLVTVAVWRRWAFRRANGYAAGLLSGGSSTQMHDRVGEVSKASPAPIIRVHRDRYAARCRVHCQ